MSKPAIAAVLKAALTHGTDGMNGTEERPNGTRGVLGRGARSVRTACRQSAVLARGAMPTFANT